MKKSNNIERNNGNKGKRESRAQARLTSTGLPLQLLNGKLASRSEADRWSSWAASFASRHGAVNPHGSRASMILAAKGVVAQIFRERWIRSINLYPSIRLAARQIIASIRSTDQILMPFERQSIQSGRTARYQESLHPRGYASAVLLPDRFLPLARVFRRSSDSDDFSRVRIAQNKELVFATTRRIIENTQRVEDGLARSIAASRSMVLKQNGPSAASTKGSDVADDLRASGHPETALARAMPAVDVNELTDQVIRQIDQRTTAWRERMGRI